MCFHFLLQSGVYARVVRIVCVVGEVVEGGREGAANETNKSLKLSRFAWEALRPVICSVMPLQ